MNSNLLQLPKTPRSTLKLSLISLLMLEPQRHTRPRSRSHSKHATVMLRRQSRTFLSYLMKPLADSFTRSFKEK